MPDTPPTPPPHNDPRLEIPEVLRTPVKRPEYTGDSKPATATSTLGDLGSAMAIGIDFLASAAAGGFLGWLLDRFTPTAPYGLVVGLVVGFIAGTFRLIRRLNAPEKPRSSSRN